MRNLSKIFVFIIYIFENLKTITPHINSAQVLEELSPFQKLFSQIDGFDSKKYDGLRGELLGHLKQVIRTALKKAQLEEEIGYLKAFKKLAQRIQIRFIPRALVESVEEEFDIPYKNAMESIRKEITLLEAEEKKIPGDITHIENQLKNVHLKSDIKQSKEQQKSDLIERQKVVCQKIEDLQNELPPPTADKINNRATRIAKRKHLWLWILKNGSKNNHVRKILTYINKWYNSKTEKYRTETSLDEYKDMFCNAMATTPEEINTTIAHVLQRVPIKPGFEFKKTPVYRKEELDEFIAILINAIGLSEALSSSEEIDELEIPGAITQKIE